MNQDIDIYSIVNQLREYELSLSASRDIKNSMDAAKAEGFKKGKAEGKAEGRAEGLKEGSRNTTLAYVKKMKDEGLSDELISKITGLSIEQIKNL